MKKMIVLLPIVLLAATMAMAQVISGNYAIKNVQTGMLLRVKDAESKNGTPLVAYYPQNWKCMTWDFKNTGPNTYQLQNLLTNKTFQAQGEVGQGVALEEQPLTANASSQQYEFIPVKADVFLIRLKGSDLYITPADAEGKVNSAIVLAKKNNAPTQYWSIYKQAPTM
jgi:Ricin-type beta-trefoil lectin domain-like